MTIDDGPSLFIDARRHRFCETRNAVRSLMSSRNSIRVRAFSRNAPSMELVTQNEFCFSTPRIDMHRWVASMTTATPSGLIFSRIVSAIWLVSRS